MEEGQARGGGGARAERAQQLHVSSAHGGGGGNDRRLVMIDVRIEGGCRRYLCGDGVGGLRRFRRTNDQTYN